ncbi:MAG TPA: TolC family protein [Bryobacteraceae bacterium]|jgi:outer membrane protein TolC|nr:TolC family protein [Bryobacteraceae bacterium]
MTKKHADRLSRLFIAVAAFAAAVHVDAQVSTQTAGQQTVANQLPLSGRGASNGSVAATQSAIPGTTSSVNTINTSVQTSGPYAGSASSAAIPFSGKLSFEEAIRRGLQYNLGAVGLNNAVRQASGLSRVSRSALLPNLNTTLSETVEQTDLQALGLRLSSPFPGVAIPTVVGPFNYFDLRARLTQTVADMTALNNYRSSKETVKADQFSMRDARDLVVLAVGGAYLQVIAAQARMESVRAQLETAEVEYKQASEKRSAGVLALTDLNRSEVELLTTRERVVSLENDNAKQRINLARLVGLPVTDHFQISDSIPFSPAPPMELEAALRQALSQRPDLQAAQTQIRAAQFTRSAARAERLPSLSLNADYGVIGTNPAESHGTFSVVGTLRIPIWLGGRTEGDIEEADAALQQRKAELEDVRGHIENDIRSAFLDLQAAAAQVDVARRNLDVTRETLDLTRQRVDAGVAEYVEMIQAREAVASANLDYINSVFSHNVAKLSLARAIGGAAENLRTFFAPFR